MKEDTLFIAGCCFTGHRPEKLRWSESDIRAGLEQEINKAITEGIHVFITGMSRGVDIWAAEAVIRAREENNEEKVELICAVPYEGFERSWQPEWKERYHSVWEQADKVVYISEHYHRGCFQKRNCWMVDHSVKVIAVFDGKVGGTKNTILYAEKKGIPVSFVQI